MKLHDAQQKLLQRKNRFSLRLDELFDRLGEPESKRFLPRELRQGAREVVACRFVFDDGEMEVFCPMELIDGEQCVVDGWVSAEPRAETPRKSTGWRQLTFGDAEEP